MEPVNTKFKVNLCFEIELGKIDVTPGSGQLPEEIYTNQVAAEGRETAFQCMSDDGTVRRYCVSAEVEAPDTGTACSLLKRYFETIPSFDMVAMSADLVGATSSAAAPESDSGAQQSEATTAPLSPIAESAPVAKYSAAVHFMLLVGLDVAQELTKSLSGVRVTPNGTKDYEFFARFDVEAVNSVEAAEAAENRLTTALDLEPGSHADSFEIIGVEVTFVGPVVTTDN